MPLLAAQRAYLQRRFGPPRRAPESCLWCGELEVAPSAREPASPSPTLGFELAAQRLIQTESNDEVPADTVTRDPRGGHNGWSTFALKRVVCVQRAVAHAVCGDDRDVVE